MRNAALASSAKGSRAHKSEGMIRTTNLDIDA